MAVAAGIGEIRMRLMAVGEFRFFVKCLQAETADSQWISGEAIFRINPFIRFLITLENPQFLQKNWISPGKNFIVRDVPVWKDGILVVISQRLRRILQLLFWVCFQMFQGFESSSGAAQMLHVDRTFDVLITDDNASFRRVLREVLEDRPFLRLHEAESGEHALEVVTIQRIDIVLLDMHMHVLTGLETLKVLKRLDRLRPCILITSDTSDELHRDAREAEAFSVLRKPVPPRQLLQTVSTALATAYSA